MVLIGKDIHTGATCLFFRNLSDKSDINVYGHVSFHTIQLNQKKIEIQVLGNESYTLSSKLIVRANLLNPQHFLLDAAIFVLEDPTIINNNPILNPLVSVEFYNEREINTNTNVHIIYAANSSVVSDTVKIERTHYFLGSIEKVLTRQNMPESEFIMLDEDAKLGLSGSPVIQNNKVLGLISRGTSDLRNKKNFQRKNKCLAIKSFNLYHWFKQCTEVIHNYCKNRPEVIASLGKNNVMNSLEPRLKPQICDLGMLYVQYHFSNTTNRKHLGVYIENIHKNMLNAGFFPRTYEESAYGTPIKTLLNTNQEFVDDFYLNELNTRHYITKLRYTDRITKELVDIDYIEKGNTANIDEYAFRGDINSNVEITCEFETKNSDDTVSKSSKTYTLIPQPTTERINNKNYARMSSELSGVYHDNHTRDFVKVFRWHSYVEHYTESSAVKRTKLRWMKMITPSYTCRFCCCNWFSAVASFVKNTIVDPVVHNVVDPVVQPAIHAVESVPVIGTIVKQGSDLVKDAASEVVGRVVDTAVHTALEHLIGPEGAEVAAEAGEAAEVGAEVAAA